MAKPYTPTPASSAKPDAPSAYDAGRSGFRHLQDPPPAPRFLHTCGADVETRIVRAACGEPLGGGGLVTVLEDEAVWH
ncbi:hypothetical protein [Nonomuraea sp. NPDC005650]|uniref:hypothetical protein n=1 Tax=Nonomuraea sp. NPDC005650 TaxID=3157045 RepID=UPI0033BA3119